MVSKLATVAFKGIEILEVSVEVQISSGIPNFTIVGLPDKTVAESKERIRASFFSLGLSLPQHRIIVNLAPADLLKEGAHYDLPIALGILAALKIFDNTQLQEYVILGALSLDSTITKVTGILPTAIFANSTNRGLICPAENTNEALWAGQNLKILPSSNLISLVNHFKGETLIPPPIFKEITSLKNSTTQNSQNDMSEIRGQYMLKRVFEIAAAGKHNVLMIGPPGAGKSMIANSLMTILPPLTPTEAIESTMIYSIAGLLPANGLISERPFRSPHHSASLVSLVGGGIRAKPGEISLAHNGVLFLDELPEFSRSTIEALRQPLETGNISIARANQHVTYPAKIQLIAAMNPCRCGYYGIVAKECTRAPKCVSDYQAKISGPLLDRFDIIVYVPQVSIEHLLPSENIKIEKSESIKKRVMSAIDFRESRQSFASETSEKIYNLKEDVQEFLKKSILNLQLSARGCNRIIKVARTIADFSQELDIKTEHISEAINYRHSLLGNY